MCRPVALFFVGEGGDGLVNELVFCPFVQITTFHEEAGKGEETAYLKVFALVGNPLECLGGGYA